MMKKLVLLGALTGLMSSAVWAQDLKEINMVYVKSPFNLQCMVMKEQGLLEKAFAKDGIKVNWHTITSGAKQAQAMASGDIDVSAVMNTASVLMSNGADNPVYIISGVAHPADTFAIVGKKGQPMDIKSLKGKKIAGPRGTVLHQMLVAALAKNGMTMDDVEFVSMGLPAALTAVSSGQVDASLLAASLVIKAEQAGCKVMTTAKDLVNVNLVMTARAKFIQEHPEAVAKIVGVEKQALTWINANKDEAVALGAKIHGISLDDAKKLASWSNYYQTLTSADIKGLKADQTFLLDNKLMAKKINVEKIVWKTALEK